VVTEFGVPEATVARIAETAGVSQGTLYVYFDSREQILMAALDAIFEQMSDLIESSAGLGALDRIITIARRHSELMKTERGGFAVPWVEFIAAGPQVGLRDAVAQTQTRAFEKMLKIVRQGQEDGTIRSDLDPRRLTWQWYTIMWAENVSTLMGLSEYIDAGHSAYSLDLLVRDMTVPPAG
jgi:TetR/AcrR family fatty acid metabolism transcriptional regulator